MKIYIFLLSGLLLAAQPAAAESHLFENAYNSVKDKGEVFKPGGAWFPYPAYEDRQAWESLCKPFKENILKIAD